MGGGGIGPCGPHPICRKPKKQDQNEEAEALEDRNDEPEVGVIYESEKEHDYHYHIPKSREAHQRHQVRGPTLRHDGELPATLRVRSRAIPIPIALDCLQAT